MRVLCFVPQSRVYPRSIQSILALAWVDGIDFCFWQIGDEPDAHRYDNMTRKYQEGRRMALEEGYDALLCVEDDIMVPPDALVRLAALNSDVAYGLVCARYEPYFWSAALEVSNESGYKPLNDDVHLRCAVWGQSTPIAGCGLFCTLIRRHVLETLDFRRDTANSCDWDFAIDCQREGLSQVVDTSVVCGHILPGQITAVYPDPETGYRMVTL